jgi:hypothetical protein
MLFTTMAGTSNAGRKGSVTKEKVSKLEHAFAIGASVKEALSYAEISRPAYYRFLDKNPQFRDTFEGLRTQPILKSLQTVYDNLDDVENAKWLLERRRKDEYSTKQEMGGEVRLNLWREFITKASEDAPKYDEEQINRRY